MRPLLLLVALAATVFGQDEQNAAANRYGYGKIQTAPINRGPKNNFHSAIRYFTLYQFNSYDCFRCRYRACDAD
eukprot:scaffold110739_cov34-Prasinocladus_malaysianus.AAC.1